MLSYLIAESPEYCYQFAKNAEDRVLDREVRSAGNITGLFDVHESVHLDTVMKGNNKMQMYKLTL